jgi:signal transduction histidine kinase
MRNGGAQAPRFSGGVSAAAAISPLCFLPYRTAPTRRRSFGFAESVLSPGEFGSFLPVPDAWTLFGGFMRVRRPRDRASDVNGEVVRNGHAVACSELIGDVARDITQQHWPLHEARQEVEELASANRRKDEFLAIVAHELRSPLASIRYAVRILGKRKSEVSAQQRMQAVIERQLARMGQLVEDLLDVSRITNGRLHLQRERVDLRVIVAHAIETLEPDINERGHRLQTELPEAPLWLQADPGRLEQVFVNLLANASRYTDPGGELKVWVHAREGEAIVRVRDSGIGIAAATLPHIFDLFKQGSETGPRSKAGLGVGLAVVRNLVELHGGSVTAGSAGLGQGSEFAVRLRTEMP